MINQALDFLVANLNEYVLLKTGYAGKVKLGKLTSGAGNEITGDNGIICQLVNIEEERIGKAQLPIAPPVGSNFPVRNPEIMLNLCALFAANPGDEASDYNSTLQLLSLVVQYFQGKHHFTTENSPSLDPGIGTLIVELYPLSLENQNYLWGALGVKYRASVVYRLRVVRILDDAVTGSSGAPRTIDQQGRFN